MWLNYCWLERRIMKHGPTRTAVRIGSIIFTVGFIAYVIAFAIVTLVHSSRLAFPFFAIGFFLSFPSIILAGNPFANPSHFTALLPATLFLNSFLISLIIWIFLKVQIVVDKKVYGMETSQPSSGGDGKPAPQK